jgi:hypothetical protein
VSRKRAKGGIHRRRWKRGAETRAYGDFRDYADVGGGREALIAPGDSRATTDKIIAEKLVADRLKELQERRRNRVLTGVERDAELQEFAAHHLVERSRSGQVTDGWPTMMERHMREAVACFGAKARVLRGSTGGRLPNQIRSGRVHSPTRRRPPLLWPRSARGFAPPKNRCR